MPFDSSIDEQTRSSKSDAKRSISLSIGDEHFVRSDLEDFHRICQSNHFKCFTVDQSLVVIFVEFYIVERNNLDFDLIFHFDDAFLSEDVLYKDFHFRNTCHMLYN